LRKIATAILLAGSACSREEPSAYAGWDPSMLRLEAAAAETALVPGGTMALRASGLVSDPRRVLVRMFTHYVHPERVDPQGLLVTVPPELSSMRSQWVPVQVMISTYRSPVVMMRVAVEDAP
jgi:hypothetical protein